jgi:hypothetical protein
MRVQFILYFMIVRYIITIGLSFTQDKKKSGEYDDNEVLSQRLNG